MNGAKSLWVALAVLIVSVACTSTQNQPSSPADSASPATFELQGHLMYSRTTGMDAQAIFEFSSGREHRLTRPGRFSFVRLSPDHRRILVVPSRTPPGMPLTGGTINLHGTDYEPLPVIDPTLNLGPAAWSPDGSRIAFGGWDDSNPVRTGIYTARASDMGDLVRVTTRPGLHLDEALDYSPDGKRIVFYRSVGEDPDPYFGGSLWVVGADGSHAHRITGFPDQDAGVTTGPWARWSPDGTRILFANERLVMTGGIWTVHPDGSHLTTVYSDEHGRYPGCPTWSPDGSQILFSLSTNSDFFVHEPNQLYAINSDGTNLQLVDGSHNFKSQLEWWQ